MAFNVMDMFAAPALNRLLQPQPYGPQNMLERPAAPALPPPVDVKQYPVAEVQAAPETTASVVPGAMAQSSSPPQAASRRSGINKELLNDIFLGWAMGQTPMQSLSLGAVQAAKGKNSRQNLNQTVEWLKGRGLDEASAKQIAGSPTVLADYLKQNFGSSAKNRNLINAGGGSIYNADTGEWITPPTGASRPTEYGLQPVYGQDENGNTVAFQVSKDGSIKKIDLPGGVSFTPGIASTDLGTSVIVRNNKTGQIIDTREKDVRGTASQTAAGKAQADAVVALPGFETSANQMLATIDSVANDPYLPNMLGPVNSRKYNLSPSSERVQSKLDQIGGQAFLQAFNSLKGGGAITEIEGQRATQAMARLNTAQNEADFRSALRDLRSIVEQGIANARKRAGVQPQETAPSQNSNDPLGLR